MAQCEVVCRALPIGTHFSDTFVNAPPPGVFGKKFTVYDQGKKMFFHMKASS